VSEQLLQEILMQALNGLVFGMIIALVASGLTLIFGIMDVVNFAHGEFYMVGAYMGWFAIGYTQNFWLALILAFFFVAFLGVLVEITTLRPIRGRDPLYTLMAMFGLSVFAQQAILMIFGPIAKEIKEPLVTKIPLLALEYPLYRLLIVAIAIAIFIGFWLFLQKTKYGTWIRATMQDSVMRAGSGKRRSCRPNIQRVSIDGSERYRQHLYRRRDRRHGEFARFGHRSHYDRGDSNIKFGLGQPNLCQDILLSVSCHCSPY
jgi:branched-subunit amino acid ABC-type transport system permease component